MTTKYGGGRHIIYITDARMMQIVRAKIPYLYIDSLIKLIHHGFETNKV